MIAGVAVNSQALRPWSIGCGALPGDWTGTARPVFSEQQHYPYLPKANVAKTCAASYLCLMSGGAR